MGKLTLEDLRRMRGEKQKAIDMRDSSNKDVQVIVGMGTCGIAAGAKDTFTALVDSINEKGLTNVLIRQTGCMGLCHSEPTVEVVVPGMPAVIYGMWMRRLRRRSWRSTWWAMSSSRASCSTARPSTSSRTAK